jgi:hypothetical protein
MKNKDANSRLGLYHSQSLQRIQKIKERNQAAEKPWRNGSREHFSYNWDSSIPRKWIDIKGKESFKHLNKTKPSHYPLDYLEETHTYINNICYNSKAEEKVIVPRVSPSPTPELGRHKTSPDQSPDPIQMGRTGFPVRISRKFPIVKRERLQTSDPLLSSCYSINNLHGKYSPDNSFFDSENDTSFKESHKYLVNNFALPSKLTHYRKISPENVSEAKLKSSNKDVNEFLNRFKIRQEAQLPAHIKSGLIGSKLSLVKFPSLHKRKPRYRNGSYGVLFASQDACDISITSSNP